MTKPDLSYIIDNDLRHAGDPSPTIDDFKNYAGDVWFCSHYNVFKTVSPRPKNSLERRAARFSTICAKIQALN